jgi:hypothetical protein
MVSQVVEQKTPIGSDIILPNYSGLRTGTRKTDTYTNGSVIFVSGSEFAERNSAFYWDDANERLGIGTTSPGGVIEVEDAGGDINIALDQNGNKISLNVDSEATTQPGIKVDMAAATYNAIETDARITIGTASSTAELTIDDGDGVSGDPYIHFNGARGLIGYAGDETPSGLLMAGSAGKIVMFKPNNAASTRTFLDLSGAIQLSNTTNDAGPHGTFLGSGAVFVSGGSLWFKAHTSKFTEIATA